MTTCVCGKTEFDHNMDHDAVMSVCSHCLDASWVKPTTGNMLVGDRVFVKVPISQVERDLLGIQLYFMGTKSQGYAKVVDVSGKAYYVHPESLQNGIA